MEKIFNWDGRLGSYLANETIAGTLTGSPTFFRSVKGYALKLESGKSVAWTIPSSTITKLVSHVGGSGTIRISCGANNTDIAVTDWTNTISTVSYSSITTITVTATAGYVYLSGLFIYNEITTEELNNLAVRFLNASPTSIQKTNSQYPIVTDLSSEVDSKVGSDLITPLDFNNWTTQAAASVNNTDTYTTTGIGGISKAILTVGKKYKVFVNGSTTSSTFAVHNSVDSSIKIMDGFGIVEFTTVSTQLYFRHTDSGVTNITTLTVQELTGLITAYKPSIKTVVGGQLLDISGNTKHLTNTNTHFTAEGLKYKTNSKSTGANWGNVKSIAFRIKLDSTTEKILEGAANDKLIYVNAGTVTYPDFDNCYINGVDSDTITADVWHTVVITSTTDVSMTAVTIGLNNTTYGNFIIDSVKPYNYELSVDEIKAYHNSFIKPTLIETFADGAVGDTETFGWKNVSGSGEIKERVIQQGELVTNGGFDSDAWWGKTTEWTISDGILSTLGVSGSGQYCKQLNKLTIGKKYRLSVDIITLNSGRVAICNNYFDSIGSKIKDFIATHQDVSIIGEYANQFIGSLDNISIVEIPPLPSITTGDKYWQQNVAGVRAIHYNGSTNVDASIDYFNGTSWTRLEGTLANLITNNAWLSHDGQYLLIALDAGDRFGNLLIKNEVEQ